jgi:hypothetical protein
MKLFNSFAHFDLTYTPWSYNRQGAIRTAYLDCTLRTHVTRRKICDIVGVPCIQPPTSDVIRFLYLFIISHFLALPICCLP